MLLDAKPLRICWLGLRGFPDVQGGVETHAQQLCPLLVELGCAVEVIVRSPYQLDSTPSIWRGVQFRILWSPKSRSLEAIVHTFLGVLYAGLIRRPDVLHIQAIGPSFWVPLARLLGLKVVVTHHGSDYDRQKWGAVAKLVLKLGERFAARYSNQGIVISSVIQKLMFLKYGRELILIPNGVVLNELSTSDAILVRFGLVPRKYILLVSRLVPEKRHFDLIEAFRQSKLMNWNLVIVGASDHPDEYVRDLLDLCKSTPDVVCPGFQTGLPLRELYSHAGIFVLPSSHEGLPIALLEALSYGLPVIASDIPANLEIKLPEAHYVPLGNVKALTQKLKDFAYSDFSQEAVASRRSFVSSTYDWRNIATQTIKVYNRVC